MPSRICCPDNHLTKGFSIHEAAIAVSEGRPIGICKKCGKELQYRIDHTYANDPRKKRYTFAVVRAVRLGTRLTDGENYDPFLLVLREIKTGKERFFPLFGRTADTIRSAAVSSHRSWVLRNGRRYFAGWMLALTRKKKESNCVPTNSTGSAGRATVTRSMTGCKRRRN
jgi:hypothetical protein